MKKKILLISIIILAIAILVPMGTRAATQVSTGTIYGLDYTIYEKNGERYVEITGYNYYTSSTTIMNVPETIENYPVTHIGEGAFKNNTRVTEIKLPETITTIKKDAFRQCTNLTTINIPEKVTTIEELTFWYCSNLNNINLPDSVTSIEYEAFNYCSNLKNINLPDSITSIGARAFENCTSLTKIKIPSGMSEISGSLFYGCSSLEEVEIPNSVTLISSYAFNGCTSLTKIELPTSITLIGASAFQGCTGLEEIILPNSLREITASLFNVCTNLKKVKIPNTIITIQSNAFNQCESLATIEIPASVTTIGDDCFRGCTSFTEIKIPNTVTDLGNGTFEDCTNLKTIEMPNKIYGISPKMFKNCTKLENIDIKNVSYVGESAFENCTSLKNINVPNADHIDNAAFKNCTSLEKVEAAYWRIYEIGDKAFENCINLKQVEIPNVENIRDYAFYGCTNLEIINLKNSLETIGTYAFEKCSKLSSINLPSGVESIGGWAFLGCTNLSEIHIPESAKLGINVFYGWTENQTINIEADEAPEEWIEGWNSNCNAKINYGLKRVTKIESENIRINYKIPTAVEATVTPESAYNKKLEYKSTNEEIFTIDENGIITPISNGYANVIISSTDYSNVEIRCGVTVDFWVTEITIDKTELLFNDFEKEEEINVTSILPDYADNKNVYMTTSDWEVAWTSGNKVGANGNGECEIIFYTNNRENPLATCKVVVDIKAKSLELEKESIIFDTENPQRLSANIQPYKTNNKTLKWESTNLKVALVNEDGLVTPVGEGKCEIIATTTDGTNLTDRCEVMVTYNESALSVETYKRYDQTTNIVEMYVFTNQKLMKIPSNWTRTDKDTVYVATYTKNGSYLEEVKDIYGNTRKVALIITEIDDKAPNITIKQTYNENTRTVKVEAKSDEVLGATKPTWNLSADKRTYSKTYNANGTYTTSFVDKYGNTCKVTFTIDQIDDEAPNITIKQTYDSNTNTVKVEAVSDEVLGETKPTWTLSKDKMIYSKIYNANGTYTTAFKDLSGNAISKTFTINDIEFRYNVEKEYNSKTNTVKISLTNQVGLQATKPTWKLSTDTKTYSKEYTANGTYSTKFVDIQGSEKTLTFTINEIDDIAPTLSTNIKYDAETNTVKVSVTSDETLGTTKPTWTLSEDKMTYSKTYNLNGTYTTKFQDIYGNEISKTFTVNQIQSKYEIVKTYDAVTNTTTVSVINNYGMQATKPTWTLSTDKRVYTKVYSSSGIYTTKFVDIDGKETSLTFTI